MKLTLSWLKEHLDTDWSADRLADKLTAIGLEVEEPAKRAQLLSMRLGILIALALWEAAGRGDDGRVVGVLAVGPVEAIPLDAWESVAAEARDLPWRMRQTAFEAAFPKERDDITVVIDGQPMALIDGRAACPSLESEGFALVEHRSRVASFEDAAEVEAVHADEIVALLLAQPFVSILQFLDAAVTELKVSTGSTDREGIKERIASRLERIEASFGRRILRGTGVLATIGATAPFVGLFGTVWGIMNSFFQIGQQQNSSLSVVAPGISEALFATAIGLFAAIPAVIAYNRYSARVGSYEARLQRFADKVHAQVSREMERA